jgi:hypothetical protein
VAASFSNSGFTTTYTFVSLQNETPIAAGVPGLVKYCVYVSGAPTLASLATGADGEPWITAEDSKDFLFGRPGGNKSNILLNGASTVIGTATFGNTPPASQTILLHIIDPAVCASLYGATVTTCFVKPANLNSVCNLGEGNTVAAYNAIPFGGVNCSPPSLAFEGDGVAEFGDEVALAGSARQLVSLKVLFTSYGCGVSGHWYSGDCLTNPGQAFNIPITANIYSGDTCTTDGCTQGTLLATVTQNQFIPYRPSADLVNCGGTDPYGYATGSRWSHLRRWLRVRLTQRWNKELPQCTICRNRRQRQCGLV